MTERPSGPPHPAGRAEFIAGKHVSRLLRQCLLGLLLMLLCCLPLSIWTPANQLPQPILPIVNAVGAAGICLALSLRPQHRRKALYVSTASLLAVSTTSLLAFGLRYSGAALLALVAPILLLGLEHRRRGVLLATALGLFAVGLSAGLELAYSPRVQGRVSSELLSMLFRRGAFAAVTLGGVGFLVDRFLAILRDREEFLAGVFTNLETGVMVYDLDPSGNSYLAAMNKASEQVFGVTGAQVIGRSRRELGIMVTNRFGEAGELVGRRQRCRRLGGIAEGGRGEIAAQPGLGLLERCGCQIVGPHGLTQCRQGGGDVVDRRDRRAQVEVGPVAEHPADLELGRLGL